MSPQDATDREQRLDEALAAYLRVVKDSRPSEQQQLITSHPELADELAEFFEDQDCFDRLIAPLRKALLSRVQRWQG